MLLELDHKGGLDGLQLDPKYVDNTRVSSQYQTGRFLINDGYKKTKDLDQHVDNMSIQQYVPQLGYAPIYLQSRGTNVIENSLSKTSKMTKMQLKKRPRYTIDPRLDTATDEFFREIVRPRQQLIDSEDLALAELKRAAGLSKRTLAQTPLTDKQSTATFNTLQAQYTSAQMFHQVWLGPGTFLPDKGGARLPTTRSSQLYPDPDVWRQYKNPVQDANQLPLWARGPAPANKFNDKPDDPDLLKQLEEEKKFREEHQQYANYSSNPAQFLQHQRYQPVADDGDYLDTQTFKLPAGFKKLKAQTGTATNTQSNIYEPTDADIVDFVNNQKNISWGFASYKGYKIRDIVDFLKGRTKIQPDGISDEEWKQYKQHYSLKPENPGYRQKLRTLVAKLPSFREAFKNKWVAFTAGTALAFSAYTAYKMYQHGTTNPMEGLQHVGQDFSYMANQLAGAFMPQAPEQKPHPFADMAQEYLKDANYDQYVKKYEEDSMGYIQNLLKGSLSESLYKKIYPDGPQSKLALDMADLNHEEASIIREILVGFLEGKGFKWRSDAVYKVPGWSDDISDSNKFILNDIIEKLIAKNASPELEAAWSAKSLAKIITYGYGSVIGLPAILKPIYDRYVSFQAKRIATVRGINLAGTGTGNVVGGAANALIFKDPAGLIQMLKGFAQILMTPAYAGYKAAGLPGIIAASGFLLTAGAIFAPGPTMMGLWGVKQAANAAKSSILSIGSLVQSYILRSKNPNVTVHTPEILLHATKQEDLAAGIQAQMEDKNHDEALKLHALLRHQDAQFAEVVLKNKELSQQLEQQSAQSLKLLEVIDKMNKKAQQEEIQAMVEHQLMPDHESVAEKYKIMVSKISENAKQQEEEMKKLDQLMQGFNMDLSEQNKKLISNAAQLRQWFYENQDAQTKLVQFGEGITPVVLPPIVEGTPVGPPQVFPPDDDEKQPPPVVVPQNVVQEEEKKAEPERKQNDAQQIEARITRNRIKRGTNFAKSVDTRIKRKTKAEKQAEEQEGLISLTAKTVAEQLPALISKILPGGQQLVQAQFV